MFFSIFRPSQVSFMACGMVNILDPFRVIFARPLPRTARPAAQPQLAQPIHMYSRRGKGRRKGTKGELIVPLYVGDPGGAHIHHLACALRIPPPHSVEFLATDGVKDVRRRATVKQSVSQGRPSRHFHLSRRIVPYPR